MKKQMFILSMILSFTSLNTVIGQSNKVVLKTNFEGEVIEGSIDRLINKIQEGYELRIGWQLDFDQDGQSDLEHWIDANFISILNGHVFNQIEPIYQQIPKKEIPQVQIVNSSMKWTGVIGTNGKLISRYIIPNLYSIEDKNIREIFEKRAEIKERTVATTWVIKE